MNIMKVGIRELRIADIQCELFSGTQSKGFTGIYGLVVSLILCLSTTKHLSRALIKFFPRLVMMPLIAVNEENAIIGYAWLTLEKRLGDGFSASLGLGVKNGYRGMGIGTQLMEQLILMACRNKIKIINLTVSTKNASAIALYRNFGFKTVKEIAERKWYMGPEHYIKMESNLDEGDQ